MISSHRKTAGHRFTAKDYRQFQQHFPDEAACLTYIFNERCPKGHCVKCGRGKLYPVTQRKCYACSVCGVQVHPLVRTIFERSSTPLSFWFYTVFLIVHTRNELSAKDLERQFGVTYKTAWRMRTQVHHVLQTHYKVPPRNFKRALKVVVATTV